MSGNFNEIMDTISRSAIAGIRYIYVVYGMTGEYSDRREWYVAAYFSEEKAKKHVLDATNKADELSQKYGPYDVPPGANNFDPMMETDYTGTRYTYSKVPLLDYA